MTPPPTPADPFAPPEARPWIVSDIFPPRGVHLIGGATGAGKSAFEVWLCSHVLAGRPFLGHATNPPPFWGAIVFDRGAEDRLSWWKTAGLSGLPLYCIGDDPRMTPELLDAHRTVKKRIELLEIALDRIGAPPGGVVTIDTANYFSGESRLGYANAFAAGWALAKLARQRDLTFIALMHGGKQVAGHDNRYVRLTDRIIASTGFLGACDTLCYLTSEEESGSRGFQEFAWRPHHMKGESFKLGRTPEGLFTVHHAEPLSYEAIAAAQKPKAEVNLEDYLVFVPPKATGDYITTKDLIDRAMSTWGVSESTVQRARAALETTGKIIRWHGIRGRWCKPDTMN